MTYIQNLGGETFGKTATQQTKEKITKKDNFKSDFWEMDHDNVK
jgi:hypothetical protein